MSGPAAHTLPPPWTSHFDDSSGLTYYYNTATGETTWEFPSAQQLASQPEDSYASPQEWGCPGVAFGPPGDLHEAHHLQPVQRAPSKAFSEASAFARPSQALQFPQPAHNSDLHRYSVLQPAPQRPFPQPYPLELQPYQPEMYTQQPPYCDPELPQLSQKQPYEQQPLQSAQHPGRRLLAPLPLVTPQPSQPQPQPQYPKPSRAPRKQAAPTSVDDGGVFTGAPPPGKLNKDYLSISRECVHEHKKRNTEMARSHTT